MQDIRPISTAEFRRFQALVREETGINLTDAKRALLVGRLSKRLRALGMTSFGSYLNYYSEHASEERAHLLSNITTNETRFFRESAQFDFLAQRILPSWSEQGARDLRVWSAACSTGEEPYSLAMLLHDQWLTASGVSFRIVATDISPRALDRARTGIWPISKAAQIPQPYLKRFMRKGRGAQTGNMRVSDELMRTVEFKPLNLASNDYPVEQFELIFCRNVMIYFDAPTKDRIVRQLLRHLVPGGYLFLGHAETILNGPEELSTVAPNIYIHRPR